MHAICIAVLFKCSDEHYKLVVPEIRNGFAAIDPMHTHKLIN